MQVSHRPYQKYLYFPDYFRYGSSAVHPGVASIREFALPLMVGIVCGAYSVCITGALWYVMRTKLGEKNNGQRGKPMAKWVEIRKGADFQSIGEKFGISSLTARLIRNKDITRRIRSDSTCMGTVGSLFCFCDERNHSGS